jgi:hypothetical protein
MQIDLASRMMLVNVSISVWEGRKLDKRITRKTIADNHVNDEKGLRVNKLLIDSDAFKEVQATSSEVRDFVKTNTLPWYDKGYRALLRQRYQAFVEKFHIKEQNWWAAVDHFVRVKYPAEVAKASFRLVDAFVESDYPGVNELRDRFKLTLDIAPIAGADDFRVKLDEATVTDIQDKIRAATEQRVHDAMVDVWERVEKAVQHFAARTGPDIERFHATTVTNMVELVDLLPALNLTNDPKLKEMATKLRSTLCTYDPKDLKKDLSVRKAANQDAAKIMEDMESFMQAFR